MFLLRVMKWNRPSDSKLYAEPKKDFGEERKSAGCTRRILDVEEMEALSGEHLVHNMGAKVEGYWVSVVSG